MERKLHWDQFNKNQGEGIRLATLFRSMNSGSLATDLNPLKMLKKLFSPGNLPCSTNIALLIFRLWLGLTLMLNHGLGKLKGFNEMASNFADPLGIGHAPSLVLAIFAEVIASGLLVLGLTTRFAALVLIINMGVA